MSGCSTRQHAISQQRQLALLHHSNGPLTSLWSGSSPAEPRCRCRPGHPARLGRCHGRSARWPRPAPLCCSPAGGTPRAPPAVQRNRCRRCPCRPRGGDRTESRLAAGDLRLTREGSHAGRWWADARSACSRQAAVATCPGACSPLAVVPDLHPACSGIHFGARHKANLDCSCRVGGANSNEGQHATCSALEDFRAQWQRWLHRGLQHSRPPQSGLPPTFGCGARGVVAAAQANVLAVGAGGVAPAAREVPGEVQKP